MVIRIKNIVDACDTAAQGNLVFSRVSAHLRRGGVMVVDFSGVDNVTSSFVNAAFVPLLMHASFDDIRERLKVIGANRQIAGMLKSRMASEHARTAEAA